MKKWLITLVGGALLVGMPMYASADDDGGAILGGVFGGLLGSALVAPYPYSYTTTYYRYGAPPPVVVEHYAPPPRYWYWDGPRRWHRDDRWHDDDWGRRHWRRGEGRDWH